VTELTAFLNARLDETEATASRAGPARIAWLTHRDAVYDPVRVLREVEAIRAIIKLRGEAFDPRFDDDPWNAGYDRAMWGVLGNLAAVWSDHPDYRQEWKP
jgi:Family of unknown function (DUF6221)